MNIVAYVDEAGKMGYSRNLVSDHDNMLGVMCALAYPSEYLDEMREAYRDGFNRFCAAAPQGAKIHFTDAFKPGNEAWAAVAGSVREEFFELIRSQQVPVIYDARRLLLEREAHERLEALKMKAKAAKRSRIRIPETDRPSTERIETQIIQGLALKLEVLAEELNRDCVDLYFDEIDIELRRHYEQTIDGLRNIATSSHIVKGWDPDTRQEVSGTISFSVRTPPFEMDVKRIGRVIVAGKSDPLVLATDAVSNALHYHLLKCLPTNAKLNAPSSIEAWVLGDRVWGVRDDAFEDII
ncbi:MAG: hypothetical protein WC091_10730 [Sulfuricellaceae bacterium]